MVNLTRKSGSVTSVTDDHRKVASLHGIKPHDFFGVISGATGDVRCVICNKRLTDALSVERMVGPKCFGDLYKEAPPLDEDTFAKVMGMVAALDSRVNASDGAIDHDVIDFILAHPNDSRAVANILVAWGSVNARKGSPAKVLAVTPILRELGYPTLANRLEKDRTPFHLFVEGETVYLRAPRSEARTLIEKLPWVGVKPVPCSDKGRKKYLKIPTADKAVLWAVLKHQFEGVALSIEGKGLVVLPPVSEREKAALNGLDPQSSEVQPVKDVILKEDEDRLILNSPPPWESGEAASFVNTLKGIRGRWWHSEEKHWSVPKDAIKGIEHAAQAVGFTIRWAV
jgi:hypothetical protein